MSNEEARLLLERIYAAAWNDENRWSGGVCVGTPVFADRIFVKRFIKDYERMNAGEEQAQNGSQ